MYQVGVRKLSDWTIKHSHCLPPRILALTDRVREGGEEGGFFKILFFTKKKKEKEKKRRKRSNYSFLT